MDNQEKNELIVLGQFIRDGLQDELLRCFKNRAPIPTCGEINGGEYYKFNLNIIFSLNHIRNHVNNIQKALNAVANTFINEYHLVLFQYLQEVFDLIENPIKSKTIDSIIGYANRHPNSTLICGSEDVLFFEQHKDWIEGSLKNNTGKNEPYLHGFIGETAIYVNPIQFISNKVIYFVDRPLIEYGLLVENTEISSEYSIKEDDIEINLNPGEVYYRISPNLDAIKAFVLENYENYEN